MRTTVRKAMLLSAVAVSLTACSDERPAPTAAAEQYSPELAASVASEQARIDSLQRRAMTMDVVTSDGLLGGLLGGVTGLLTGVVNGLTYTLLSCDLLPYAGSTKVIGPAGGTISVGRSSLVIPAGALASNTVISMEQLRTNDSQVRFSPHGLQFAKSAALTVSYAHCAQPSGYLRGLVYIDQDGQIAEAPPSVDNFVTDKVTGSIGHFSGYAVAHTRIRQ